MLFYFNTSFVLLSSLHSWWTVILTWYTQLKCFVYDQIILWFPLSLSPSLTHSHTLFMLLAENVFVYFNMSQAIFHLHTCSCSHYDYMFNVHGHTASTFTTSTDLITWNVNNSQPFFLCFSPIFLTYEQCHCNATVRVGKKTKRKHTQLIICTVQSAENCPYIFATWMLLKPNCRPKEVNSSQRMKRNEKKMNGA